MLGQGGGRDDSGCVLRGGVGAAAGFPELGRAELVRHFTLNGADEAFLRKFRTGRNVLGVAVQMCAPCPGWGSCPTVPAVPKLTATQCRPSISAANSASNAATDNGDGVDTRIQDSSPS